MGAGTSKRLYLWRETTSARRFLEAEALMRPHLQRSQRDHLPPARPCLPACSPNEPHDSLLNSGQFRLAAARWLRRTTPGPARRSSERKIPVAQRRGNRSGAAWGGAWTERPARRLGAPAGRAVRNADAGAARSARAARALLVWPAVMFCCPRRSRPATDRCWVCPATLSDS